LLIQHACQPACLSADLPSGCYNRGIPCLITFMHICYVDSLVALLSVRPFFHLSIHIWCSSVS